MGKNVLKFSKLADWFQKRRLLNNFPIGSHVKTISADGGHFEPRSGSLNTIDILKGTYLCQVSDTGSPEPLVLFSDLYNFFFF
jgi:hypothetical protein